MGEEANSMQVEKRYAVVTGANKGIGFGICQHLAAEGNIVIVLTDIDEKRGPEAVDKLKASGFSSDNLFFHQLDVSDQSSVASFAKFINSQFGKIDILVNNAGIAGVKVDIDAIKASAIPGEMPDFVKYMTSNYELGAKCIQTNYYGAKNMIEAFIPFLQKSKSPRIVSVSSSMGQLEYIPDGRTTEILTDGDEDKIDRVIDEFLQDLKSDALVAKGWTTYVPAYSLSKAAVNSYTRIVAKKYPNFKVNSVCPGFVKTDLTYDTGILSIEEGAAAPVKLALLPDDGPSGLFFQRYEVADI